ncbi:MAG TPA: YitT family protein [Prevotella sp.]
MEQMKRSRLYREVMDYVMIAVGMLSYCIGWTVFLLPNNISTGGVAGLSSIVFWGMHIPVGTTYFVVNFILLAVALRVLGVKFCIKTIYGVALLTSFVWIFHYLFPNPTILTDQPFMASVIGACFCGVGIGFGLSYNGSTGGSDIVAAIVNKYRDVSLGRIILLTDMSIVTLSYVVLHSWEQVIYGYVVLIITSFVLDQVINSARSSVQFFIISEKYEEIGRRITTEPLHRGCTVIDAGGFYSGKEVKMLFVLTKRRESALIFQMIDEIDPQAFVSQSSVIGVYGNGFDHLKLKKRQPEEKA